MVFKNRESGQIFLVLQISSKSIFFWHEIVSCISESCTSHHSMLILEWFTLFVPFSPIWQTSIVKMLRWCKPIFGQTLSFWKLLIISVIIFCHIIVVFVMEKSFWIRLTNSFTSFVLSTWHEFLDGRPFLLHVGSFVEINSIADLLVDSRVENQPLVSCRLWGHSTQRSLSFRHLHTVKFACGVLHICEHIFDYLLLCLICSFLNSFACWVRAKLTWSNLFEIISGRSHIGWLQIHVSFDPWISFQQGEPLLDGVLTINLVITFLATYSEVYVFFWYSSQ